ncbi:MAG: hypothetical protein VKQ33_09870 [Candidatus Sericytochromatia bacterium]|nr:hypothetical protein [Candidatus Sericytochromatia bacterium]
MPFGSRPTLPGSTTLLACLVAALAAPPAQARLGEPAGEAREFARAQGARALELHLGPRPWWLGEPLVLAETWQAPAAGWSREKANTLIKALVNHRRRLLLKTSRAGEGWTFTLRFEEDVVATCRYIQGRVRQLHVRSATFDQAPPPRPEPLHFVFPATATVRVP